jgi:valyl-tRNA synthetase
LWVSLSIWQHLHGKFVVHPFVPRRLPIVTDDIAVDMTFGTGAVKITPAHDPDDYEVGQRHKLDFINILKDDGTLNGNAGEQFKVDDVTGLEVRLFADAKQFKGMKRFHARVAVVQALKDAGLYIDKKDNPMQIPICRCVASCSSIETFADSF